MALLAALLLLAQVPRPLADLPFEHIDGHIWLAGRLNDRPVHVLLDTGATFTVADERVALAAGAAKGEAVAVNANGPNGVAAWAAKGLALTLDGIEVIQPVTLTLPLDTAFVLVPPLEAILGTDFLRRYTVEIDYARSRVRLFASDAYRLPKGYAALPVRFDGDRPVVEGELRVNGRRVPKASMLLDTGAFVGLDLTKSLLQRLDIGVVDLVTKHPPYPVTVGLGGQSYLVDVPGVGVRLGGSSLKVDARLVLSDGGASGEKAGYDAILGDDVLRRFDLVLDYAHSRVYVRGNGR